FSSRRRHTRWPRDWSSDVCSSDLKSRIGTFYESSAVTHIDVSQPYCPKIREILTSSTLATGRSRPKDVVMACTEGPRYETSAERSEERRVGKECRSREVEVNSK